jgi:hypothetical protein
MSTAVNATTLTGIASVEQYGELLDKINAAFGQTEVTGLKLLAPANSGSNPIAGGTGSYAGDRSATSAKVAAWTPADAGVLQLQIQIELAGKLQAWQSIDSALVQASAGV